MTRNSLGSGCYQEPKHKVPVGCNCMIDDTWLHSLFCLFRSIFGLHSLNWRLIDKAGSVYFDDMNAHNYINNIPSQSYPPWTLLLSLSVSMRCWRIPIFSNITPFKESGSKQQLRSRSSTSWLSNLTLSLQLGPLNRGISFLGQAFAAAACTLFRLRQKNMINFRAFTNHN